MEEFLLRFLCICYELYVVHDQDIILSILIFKTIRSAGAHGVNVINSEPLGSHIQHLFVGVNLLKAVSYCLYKMCLAMPRRAVDEKGVVCEAWPLKHCLRGCVRQLIEGANHEGIKSVARVQIIALVNVKLLQIKRGIFFRRRSSTLFALCRRCCSV